MIIETREDVVRLSGTLHKNQWMTIKAAANLLLVDHPEGIIVDCSSMQGISDDGAKTFLEAMRDIEAAHSRIIVANLPEQVMTKCRSIPGVRSQLPIADSVEAARASLRAAKTMNSKLHGADSGKRGALLFVPLIAGIDLSYGVTLAQRTANIGKAEIRLVYFLEVVRTLPLNAPMPEQEENATRTLEEVHALANPNLGHVQERVERVREAVDGIVATAKAQNADRIIIGLAKIPEEGEESEKVARLIQTLIKRAHCEVIIARKNQNE